MIVPDYDQIFFAFTKTFFLHLQKTSQICTNISVYVEVNNTNSKK